MLRKLVQWIPPGMIQRLADEHRLDIRKWSAVSHVVALMYGLFVHLLLRFMRHVAGWALSFSRLAGVVRAAVWVTRELVGILKTNGTAHRPKQGETVTKPPPLQAFFDFWRFAYGTAGP